jgi:hypothetical protein
MLIKMRLSTSALLILVSFSLGYFVRPKIAPAPIEQITFVSKSPQPLPKSEVVAGRAPQSLMAVHEAGLVQPLRETVNGIDIVQAMLNKDMAKVYAANRAYERAWRHQFVESHFRKPNWDERLKLESALVRSLPVQKEDDERLFRGRTTLEVDGQKVYIDVVMSVSLQEATIVEDEKKTETSRPCFRMDGFISAGKTVERLNFDQSRVCNERLYERSEAAFIGIDNYRHATGSLINMLLIPANPTDHLALEYLTGNTADWKKDANWSWQPAAPDSWEALNNLMIAQAQAAGVDPDSLWGGVAE